MKQIYCLLVIGIVCAFSYYANAQWSQLTVPNSSASMRTAYFKDANNGFVAGAERIRKTNNGGATWDTCNYGIYWAYLNGCIVENIHFTSATEGIAAGWVFWDNCEIVFKTHDGGNTWTDIRWGNGQAAFGTYLYDMHFPTTTTGFCVGDLGHIIKSTDGGDNWAYVSSGTTNGLKGVYFTSASNGIAVGDQVILKTTNGGTSWTSQSFTGVYFTDVTFTTATVGYAVASDAVYKTTDGGTSWNVINANLGGEDITAVNSDTLYIASYAGIFKSNNAGTQFFQQPTLYPNSNFYGIYFYNSTLGFAMNYAGNVFKTTTAGDAVQQNDAGVVGISQPAFTACQGIHPVQVKIKNYGQANLTQATINWKMNGIAQTPYVWSGNLANDSVSAFFTIGSYNFPGGNSDVIVYTTQANSISDYIHYNDTTASIYSFPRLNGAYTIGGSNPSFATVDDAISALNNYGTCGNVEFKIRNGTYQPSFNWNISNFYHTNTNDSVIFRSESGDSSQVILQGFSSAFVLSRSKNVTFSKVTIAISSSGNAITLTDSTSNINFLNCAFSLPLTQGTSLSHSGKACVNTIIKNCKFYGGQFGINLSGTGTEVLDGITIQNCLMDSIEEKGITIAFAKNISLRNNTITGFQPGFSALSLQSCNNGFVIDKNKLMTDKGDNVFYLNSCQDTLGVGSVVSNNFISIRKSYNSITQCVHFFNCIGIKMVYNSILCDIDAAIRIYQGDTLKYPMHTFQNNIVCNLRNNVIINWGMPSNVSAYYLDRVFKDLGYNAYYNAPGNQGYYPYLFFSGGDFEDWKGFYPSDSTSVFTNPQFTSYLDYHITPNTSNIRINNKGKFLSGFSTDLDGVVRSATPDIGCAEFSLYNTDAGVKSFLASTRICSGINAVEVRVGNFGLSNITSGTINWTVNGVAQTPYAWSGNIANGDSSSIISIGSYNFVNGNSYSVKAWMSNANSNADINHINDTSTITVDAKGLSGTYTIGGASPSYSTFAAAAADLILNGVCGPVTFNVRNGIYQDSLPLTPVAGASLLNTITFQSETGDSTAVTLWNIGRKVLRLDTAGYITFNRITIVDSTLGSSQAAIYCQGTPHHITIKNCIIRSNSGSFSVWNDGKVITDFNFDNNLFSGGNSAISLSFGGLGFYLCKNISITNNRFQNKNGTIISIARGANLKIDRNNFYSYLYFSPSSAYAIQLTGSVTSKIEVTNNIINLRNYNQGINYSGNGQPHDKSLFANNMVSIIGPAGGFCFFMQGSKNVKLVYNSAVSDSGNASSAVTYAPETGSELYNNSFYNKGSGNAVYFGNTGYYSDYNNFYASTAPPIKSSSIAYSLGSWQLFSGMDANSYSGDPVYVSQTDLHSAGSYYLNGNGIALNEVTKDIDGDIRSSSPDIGADDFPFTLQVNDAGVKDVENPDTLCAGVYPVKVRIRNFGSAVLTSATINWSVNGIPQTPYVWNGSLSSLAISNYFSIGNYTFGALDTFDIVAWTTNPNGVSDGAAVNDTSKLPGILTRMQGVYTIGGTNPDFATLVLALQKIKSIGICGPVTFNLRNGSHPGPNNNISAFVGLSPTNTWTIQSESGDSNAVIVTNNNLTATLLFSNVDYTRVRNITVNSWGSYDAVRFDNGSEYNTVSGCILNARLTIYYNSHHNIFENNLVNNEIYVNGQSNLYGIGNIIRNNTILNPTGIHFYYQDSIEIIGNTIDNVTGQMPGSNFGIKTLGNNSHHVVLKNKITGNFSRMLDISADGSLGDTAIIANNILVAGNNAGVGVHLQVGYVKFVYNTIYVPATSQAAPLQNVSMPFDDGLVVYNNQFITYNNEYACYWGQLTWTTSTLSDYNNYFTNGSTLINITLSSLYPTIDSFSTAHPGYDEHSTDVDPQFSSPQFLYPTNALAQGTGIPISDVIDDYNGLLRNPNNPTIGALEAPPIIVDDSLNKDVAITLLNTNLSLGNNTISVQVNNLKPFLIDTVFHNFVGTVDTLYLSYSVNGSAPVTEMWTGNLALYDSITFNFNQKYNVPKGRLYTVFVQVTLPSSYNTLALQNDTATFEIGLPMVGIYTVGGSNPDFVNLNEANYNYYKIHTSGSCTFNIRPGLDSLFSIYEYQDYNPLTFRSETGNANDVEIKISNIYDSYMINFKNVTLYPRTDYGYLYNYKGAEFIGGHFSIDSCVIRGLSDPAYRNGLTFVHCDSVSVTNCQFVDLQNGINFSDYTWFGSNYFNGKCYVMNNTFDSLHTCVRVLGWMTDSVFITNNLMNNPYTGINYDCDGYSAPAVISYNKINNATGMAMDIGNFNSGYINAMHCHNNMMSGRVSIYDQGTHPIYFYYNSIYGFLEFTNCAELHSRNNSVFSNTTTPALLFSQNSYPSTIYDCDYNNYYSPLASHLAYFSIMGGNSGNAINIKDLITLTGAEQHSKNIHPYYADTTDLHSNSFKLSGAGTPVAGIDFDIDGDVRSATKPDIGCDEFTPVDSLVWPGDCNYDGIANNYDLLSVGLYTSQTGPFRSQVSTAWQGWPATDWSSTQYNGFNKKHADCDGDGVISKPDVNVISQNYGQSHPAKPVTVKLLSLTQPALHFVTNDTLVGPGDSVHVEIHAGDASNVLNPIYGIAFDVAYPSNLVMPGSMELTFPPSFLGIDNVTTYTVANIGVTASGTVVRSTGTDTSGYGMFALLTFVIDPSVTSVTSLQLDFAGYLALQANGDSVILGLESDSIAVDPAATISENSFSNHIQVYPNPATDETVISYLLTSSSQVKIELLNSIGEIIKVMKEEKQQAGNHNLKINFSNDHYSKGIYFVKMMVDGKVYAKKIVVE